MARKHDFHFFLSLSIFFQLKNKEIWVGFFKPCLGKFFWRHFILKSIFKSIYEFFALFPLSICPLCNIAKSLGRWMQSYFTFEKSTPDLFPLLNVTMISILVISKENNKEFWKKVTLEFWMGMPNTLKFFFREIEEIKKNDIPISRKKTLFFEMLAAELLKWYDFKAYDKNNWVIFYINI